MAKKKRRSRKKRTRRLMHERLEQRRLLASDIAASWQNVANPLDINADGLVTPLDALALGMEWGSNGPGPLGSPSAEADRPTSYVDVDGDGALTAQDFDAVFTHLNGLSEPGDGVLDGAADGAEGEAGSRGRNESLPPSRSGLEVAASRHGAVVQFAEDFLFAIDVHAGLTREFQMIQPEGRHRVQASGGPLGAGSPLEGTVSTVPTLKEIARQQRQNDLAVERIRNAVERLYGPDFAQAKAGLLTGRLMIDQLAETLAAGEATSLRAGRVAPLSVAVGPFERDEGLVASTFGAEGEDPNYPPWAGDDLYDVPDGATLIEGAPGVMWNDGDQDGDDIEVSPVTGPSHAESFTLNSDGSFTYKPMPLDATWSGFDSFVYSVDDGQETTLATAYLKVTGLEVSVADVTVTEGEDAWFTITLSQPINELVYVSLVTSAGTATEGPLAVAGDYLAASRSDYLGPGQTELSFPVTTIADQEIEPDEDFQVAVSAELFDGTPIGSAYATGTITDAPYSQVIIDDVTVTEGETATFTVTLTTNSTEMTSVSYLTDDGSAHDGSDYEFTGGWLHFYPGETQKTSERTPER